MSSIPRRPAAKPTPEAKAEAWARIRLAVQAELWQSGSPVPLEVILESGRIAATLIGGTSIGDDARD